METRTYEDEPTEDPQQQNALEFNMTETLVNSSLASNYKLPDNNTHLEMNELEPVDDSFLQTAESSCSEDVITLESEGQNLVGSSPEMKMKTKGNIICDYEGCGKAVKSQYHLLRHQVVHTNEKAFECEGCAKKFSVRSRLMNHWTTVHLDEKRFICNMGNCCKAFRSKYDLTRHQSVHSDDNNRPFSCDEPGCDKKFTRKEYLMKHMAVHCDEKRYVCDVEGCGKAFPIKSYLKKHYMAVHLGVKPFVCDVLGCGRRFTQHSELLIHLGAHLDERPFECTVEGCGKRFKRKNILNQHVKFHFEVQLFKCEFKGCEKSFKRKGTLNEHMLIHSNERPFVCGVESCARAFYRRRDLIKHLRIHQKGKKVKAKKDESVLLQSD